MTNQNIFKFWQSNAIGTLALKALKKPTYFIEDYTGVWVETGGEFGESSTVL